MPLFPMYFSPLSPQQANPMLTGMQMGQQVVGQNLANVGTGIRNALMQAQVPYAPQMAQQALLGRQLANALQQNTLTYAPQTSQAAIALREAQANAQNAAAGLTGQQTNLLRQQTPYLVQQAQEKLFSDPVLNRLNQIAIAQRTGAIPNNLMELIGQGAPNGSANAGAGPFSIGAPAAPGTLPSYLSNASAGNPAAVASPKAFIGSPASNFALFGSPYNPIQFAAWQKGAETQAGTGVTQYNKAQEEAAQSGDIGNQVSNLVDQFKNAYANTDLTGPFAGRAPAITGAAQAADNASQNLAATVAKLIAGGRVTNYEMQYVSHLKPNRVMTPATAQMTATFLQQKAQRMEEEQPFLTTARNMGVPVQTAQTLWQQYNNQRPVYNFSTNTPNTQFQKSWKQYLTPQAIEAAESGKDYVPLPQFTSKAQYQAWIKTLAPSDRQALMNELAQKEQR